MNRRQNCILKDVLDGEYKTLLETSKIFDVSERTIRNDLKQINMTVYCKPHSLLVISEKGKICFKENEKIDKTYLASFFEEKDYYSYKLSPNERKTILALVLLKSNTYKTIANLSEMVFMSRNTLIKDLDDLKEWFKENKMVLVSSTRKGFLVDGSEKKIREGMMKLLMLNGDLLLSYENNNRNIIHTFIMRELDEDGIFEEIEELIKDMEIKNDVRFTDFSYRELVYYCLIMVNRIRKAKTIFFAEEPDWEKLQKSTKYNMARGFMKDLSMKFGFEENSYETAMLIESLRSKSYIKNNGKRIDMLEVQILINEFIYKISVSLQINYYLDFYLYDLLVAHIRAGVHRIRQGHPIINPLKNQLKNAYPYVFDEVRRNIKTMEEYIKSDFSDDEIAFITMYIVSVLEKTKGQDVKVNILIVCNSGQGTAQLVSARIQSICKQAEVIDIVSSHYLKGINFENIDVIISTVPLRNMTLPWIHVNPILAQEDLHNTQKVIMSIQDDKQKNMYRTQFNLNKAQIQTVNVPESGSEYLDSLFVSKNKFADILSLDMIMLDVEAENWEEAVRKAGKLLYSKNKITAQYIDAMIENIKVNGPYVVIYPGVAVPHAQQSDGALEVGASLIRLKKTVHFDHELNDPVKFVIALSVLDTGSIDRPLYNLTKIMATKTFISDLSNASTKEEIMQIIKNYEDRG